MHLYHTSKGHGDKWVKTTAYQVNFFNVIGFFRIQQHVHCPWSVDKSQKPKSFRKFGCQSLDLMVHFFAGVGYILYLKNTTKVLTNLKAI